MMAGRGVHSTNPHRFDGLLAARERRQQHAARKREARIAAGMCSRCGERAPVDGRRWCAACVEWGRAYAKDIGATHRVLPGDRLPTATPIRGTTKEGT